jgi:hypothetical protein
MRSPSEQILNSLGFFQKCRLRFYLIRKRRILKCIHYNFLITEKILFDKFNEKFKDRKANYKEKLASLVVTKVFGIPVPASYNSFLGENADTINSEIDNVREIAVLEERRIRHLKLVRYYWGNSLNYLPDDNPDKFQLMSGNIPLISKEEFKRICRSDFNQYKAAKKELLEQIKIEKESEALEKIPKIEISPQNIVVIVTLFSVLFLISGFIYNQIYLGYFGVELSKFFNVADYLASSADKIYYTLVSLAITLSIGLLIYPEYLRGELPKRPKSKWIRRIDDIMYYALIPLFGLSSLVSYLQKNSNNFYFSLRFLIFFISLYVVVRIMKYFKNPIRSYFILFGLMMFLLNICFGAIEDINSTLNKDYKELRRYRIEFTRDSQFDDKNLILLASTTNYFIFYNKKHLRTQIVPSKFIVSIEPCKNKSESGIYRFMIKPFLQNRTFE